MSRVSTGGVPTSVTAPVDMPQPPPSKRAITTLNNPVAHIANHPDLAVVEGGGSDTAGERTIASSQFAIMGSLFKRNEARDGGSDGIAEAPRARHWMQTALAKAKATASDLAGEWRERWVVVDGSTMQYWPSRQVYEAGKPGNLATPQTLRGYEVLDIIHLPTYYLQLHTAYHLLLTTYCLLLTAYYYLLLATCYLLLATCYLLLATYCLLLTTY